MADYSGLSFEEKSKVFEKALLLRKSGFGYKRIIKAVSSEFNARLPQNTLVYWLKNDVKLIGGENQFKPEPSPELCYVLGAMFGDACISINQSKGEYRARLESIDKDFAGKFSHCISKILGKGNNYAV